MELNPKLEKYIEEVVKVVNQEKGTKITPSLVKAIINQESKGDPNAVSPVGAKGLMQIMPETMAEVYPEGNPMNPYHNIMAGVTHFGTQLQIANGKVSEALASYNYGEGAVASLKKKYGEDYTDFLPAETKTYVTNILTEDLPNKKKATSKITQPANATQLTQAQIDSVKLVLSTLTKNPLDAALAFTGEEKAKAAANAMLKEFGVDGAIEKSGNTYYLKDNKSGDLYTLNPNGDLRTAMGTLFEAAPLIGGLVGVGAAFAILGVTAPLAAVALAGTAGSAVGAGGVQLAREAIETETLGETQGLKPLEGAANVAGAIGTDLGQAVVFNKALRLGGEALKLLAKIPGASALGKAINESIGKPLIEAVGTVADDIAGKGFEKLSVKARVLSKPLLDNMSNYKDSKAVREFVSFAQNLEGTLFGRTVLGLPKVTKAVNEAGEEATKAASNSSLKQKIKTFNEEIASLETQIKEKIKPEIERKEAVLTAQKGALAKVKDELGSSRSKLLSEGAESVGKALQERVNVIVNDYYSQMKSVYTDYGKHAIAKTGRSFVEVSEGALKNKDQYFKEVFDQIENAYDFKIKELKDIGKANNLEIKLKGLEDQTASDIATVQAKQQITSGSDELLNNLKTASKEEFNQIIASNKMRSDELKAGFEKSLSESKSEQALGKEVRDKVIAKWKKQLAEEKNLYDGTRPLAEQEKDILHDISDLFKGVEDTETIKEIEGKVNLKEATPADLLEIKSNIDGYLSGNAAAKGKLVPPKTYSQLAAARGKLVSDEGNIFSSSPSKALQQYQQASAMRIARNDAIQANDVANFLGRGFDSKTGNIDRNTAFSKDVYEDIIDYFERDADAAERILNYAYDGNPTVVGDLRKAYINRVYNQSGKDIEKTFNKLTDASSQAKGTSNLLFNEFGDYTEELSTLAKIRENEKIPLPKSVEDLPDYEATKQMFKQDEQRDLANLKVQQIQNKANRQRQRLEVDSKIPEIRELEREKANIQKPEAISGIVKLQEELDTKINPSSQSFFTNPSNAGTKSIEEVKRLAKENPTELNRIFATANLTEAEKLEVLKSMALPARTIISENLPQGSGVTADAIIKSLPVEQQGYDVFGNQEAVKEFQKGIVRLKNLEGFYENIPNKIATTEKDLSRLIAEEAALRKQQANQIKQLGQAEALLKEKEAIKSKMEMGGALAGAGLANTASFIGGNGVDPMASLLGAAAGWAITNPVARQSAKSVAEQAGRVLGAGVDTAIQPLERALAEAATQQAGPLGNQLVEALKSAGTYFQQTPMSNEESQVLEMNPLTGILEYRTKKTPLFRLGAVPTQYQ